MNISIHDIEKITVGEKKQIEKWGGYFFKQEIIIHTKKINYFIDLSSVNKRGLLNPTKQEKNNQKSKPLCALSCPSFDENVLQRRRTYRVESDVPCDPNICYEKENFKCRLE